MASLRLLVIIALLFSIASAYWRTNHNGNGRWDPDANQDPECSPQETTIPIPNNVQLRFTNPYKSQCCPVYQEPQIGGDVTKKYTLKYDNPGDADTTGSLLDNEVKGGLCSTLSIQLGYEQGSGEDLTIVGIGFVRIAWAHGDDGGRSLVGEVVLDEGFCWTNADILFMDNDDEDLISYGEDASKACGAEEIVISATPPSLPSCGQDLIFGGQVTVQGPGFNGVASLYADSVLSPSRVNYGGSINPNAQSCESGLVYAGNPSVRCIRGNEELDCGSLSVSLVGNFLYISFAPEASTDWYINDNESVYVYLWDTIPTNTDPSSWTFEYPIPQQDANVHMLYAELTEEGFAVRYDLGLEIRELSSGKLLLCDRVFYVAFSATMGNDIANNWEVVLNRPEEEGNVPHLSIDRVCVDPDELCDQTCGRNEKRQLVFERCCPTFATVESLVAEVFDAESRAFDFANSPWLEGNYIRRCERIGTGFETCTMTMTFMLEGAGYHNVVGYFRMDGNDLDTDYGLRPLWPDVSHNYNSGGCLTAGDTIEVIVEAGYDYGWFLASNAANYSPTGKPTNERFYSFFDGAGPNLAQPDNIPHFVRIPISNWERLILFGVEDIVGGGDEDYDDSVHVVFFSQGNWVDVQTGGYDSCTGTTDVCEEAPTFGTGFVFNVGCVPHIIMDLSVGSPDKVCASYLHAPPGWEVAPMDEIAITAAQRYDYLWRTSCVVGYNPVENAVPEYIGYNSGGRCQALPTIYHFEHEEKGDCFDLRCFGHVIIRKLGVDPNSCDPFNYLQQCREGFTDYYVSEAQSNRGETFVTLYPGVDLTVNYATTLKNILQVFVVVDTFDRRTSPDDMTNVAQTLDEIFTDTFGDYLEIGVAVGFNAQNGGMITYQNFVENQADFNSALNAILPMTPSSTASSPNVVQALTAALTGNNINWFPLTQRAFFVFVRNGDANPTNEDRNALYAALDNSAAIPIIFLCDSCSGLRDRLNHERISFIDITWPNDVRGQSLGWTTAAAAELNNNHVGKVTIKEVSDPQGFASHPQVSRRHTGFGTVSQAPEATYPSSDHIYSLPGDWTNRDTRGLTSEETSLELRVLETGEVFFVRVAWNEPPELSPNDAEANPVRTYDDRTPRPFVVELTRLAKLIQLDPNQNELSIIFDAPIPELLSGDNWVESIVLEGGMSRGRDVEAGIYYRATEIVVTPISSPGEGVVRLTYRLFDGCSESDSGTITLEYTQENVPTCENLELADLTVVNGDYIADFRPFIFDPDQGDNSLRISFEDAFPTDYGEVFKGSTQLSIPSSRSTSYNRDVTFVVNEGNFGQGEWTYRVWDDDNLFSQCTVTVRRDTPNTPPTISVVPDTLTTPPGQRGNYVVTVGDVDFDDLKLYVVSTANIRFEYIAANTFGATDQSEFDGGALIRDDTDVVIELIELGGSEERSIEFGWNPLGSHPFSVTNSFFLYVEDQSGATSPSVQVLLGVPENVPPRWITDTRFTVLQREVLEFSVVGDDPNEGDTSILTIRVDELPSAGILRWDLGMDTPVVTRADFTVDSFGTRNHPQSPNPQNTQYDFAYSPGNTAAGTVVTLGGWFVDPSGLLGAGQITIEVLANPAPPESRDYGFTVERGDPLNFSIAASDEDGDLVRIVFTEISLTDAEVFIGSTTNRIEVNSFISVPPTAATSFALRYESSNFLEIGDYIRYDVFDDLGASSVVTYTTTFTGPRTERPPVANDQFFETPEETTIVPRLIRGANMPPDNSNPRVYFDDPDSESFTFHLLTRPPPSAGTFSTGGAPVPDDITGSPYRIRNRRVTFQPAPEYSGEVSYVYRVTDHVGLTDTATVTIQVNPVDDCPYVTATPSVTLRRENQDNENPLFVLGVSDVDSSEFEIRVSGLHLFPFTCDPFGNGQEDCSELLNVPENELYNSGNVPSDNVLLTTIMNDSPGDLIELNILSWLPYSTWWPEDLTSTFTVDVVADDCTISTDSSVFIRPNRSPTVFERVTGDYSISFDQEDAEQIETLFLYGTDADNYHAEVLTVNIESLPSLTGVTISPVGSPGSPYQAGDTASAEADNGDTRAQVQINVDNLVSGSTSFTYSVTDLFGATSGIRTVTINVADVNQAPEVEDLFLEILEDHCVLSCATASTEFRVVQQQDFDSSILSIIFTQLANPERGVVAWQTNQRITQLNTPLSNTIYPVWDLHYQPLPHLHSTCTQVNGETGECDTWSEFDRIPFCVTDGQLQSCANLYVYVIPVDDDPVGENVGGNANVNDPLRLTITATDPDRDVASLVLIAESFDFTTTAEGTAELFADMAATNNVLDNLVLPPATDPDLDGPAPYEWTFDLWYIGPHLVEITDTFRYYIIDDNDNTSPEYTGTVTMAKQDINPVALGKTVMVDEDSDVDIEFIYGNSVTLSPPNTHFDRDGIVDTDTVIQIISLPSDGQLTFNGSPVSEGQILTGYTVNYEPEEHFNGEDSFTFIAVDIDDLDSNLATIDITINAVDDKPEIRVRPSSRRINRDAFADILVEVRDRDSLNIDIRVDTFQADDPTISELVALQFSDSLEVIDADDGSIALYTPGAPPGAGPIAVLYTVAQTEDEFFEWHPITFRWTPNFSTPDNTVGSARVRAIADEEESEENPKLSFSIEDNIPPVIRLTDGNTYNHNYDQNPMETTYDIILESTDPDVWHREDLTTTILSLPASYELINDGGNGPSITDNFDPDAGFEVDSVSVGDGTQATISVVIPGNANGAESFTFQVTDGLGRVSSVQTVQLNVAFVNQPPRGEDYTIVIDENDCVAIPNAVNTACTVTTVNGEFATIEPDDFDDTEWSIQFGTAQDTSRGRLYVGSGPSVMDDDTLYDVDISGLRVYYEPGLYLNSDCVDPTMPDTCIPFAQFSYTITDPDQESAGGVVTIIVLPIDQPPVSESVEIVAVRGTDTPLVITASDPDDDLAELVIESWTWRSTPAGTATFQDQRVADVDIVNMSPYTIPNNDGSFSFTYNGPHVISGSDRFTFTVRDSRGVESPEYEGRIIMVESASPPVARGDSFSVDEDETTPVPFQFVYGSSITLSDGEHYFDDGFPRDFVTLNLVSLPERGVLTSNGDSVNVGSEISTNMEGTPIVEYVPEENSERDEAFTFQALDSNGLVSDVATIVIDIIPEDDPPTITITPSELLDVGRESVAVFTVGLRDIDSESVSAVLNGVTLEASNPGALANSEALVVYGFDGEILFTFTELNIPESQDTWATTPLAYPDETRHFFEVHWDPRISTIDGTTGSFSLIARADGADSAPETATFGIRDNIRPETREGDDSYTISVLQNSADIVVNLEGFDANSFHTEVLDFDIDVNPGNPGGLISLVDCDTEEAITTTRRAGPDPPSQGGSVTPICIEFGNNLNGEATFEYTVTDLLGLTSDPRTVTITVAFVNQPPDLDDNLIVVYEDICFLSPCSLGTISLPERVADMIPLDFDDGTVVLTFDALADANDGVLAYLTGDPNPEASRAVVGPMTIPVGIATDFLYQPFANRHSDCDPIDTEDPADCNDYDSFEFTVTDSADQSISVQVRVVVLPVQDPPDTEDRVFLSEAGVVLKFTLRAEDPDDNIAFFEFVSTDFQSEMGTPTAAVIYKDPMDPAFDNFDDGTETPEELATEFDILVAMGYDLVGQNNAQFSNVENDEWTFYYLGHWVTENEDFITVSVTDTDGLSSTIFGERRVRIDAAKVIVDPVVQGQTLRTTEDTDLTIVFRYADSTDGLNPAANGGTTTDPPAEHYFDQGFTKATTDIVITSLPAEGTLYYGTTLVEIGSIIPKVPSLDDPIGNPTLTYVPKPEDNDAVSFTFNAIDDDGGSAENDATITIEIDPVNDPPLLVVEPALISDIERAVTAETTIRVLDWDSDTVTVSFNDLADEFTTLANSGTLVIRDEDGVAADIVYDADNLPQENMDFITITQTLPEPRDREDVPWHFLTVVWTTLERTPDDTTGYFEATASDLELFSDPDEALFEIIDNIPPEIAVPVGTPNYYFVEVDQVNNANDATLDILRLLSTDANSFHDRELEFILMTNPTSTLISIDYDTPAEEPTLPLPAGAVSFLSTESVDENPDPSGTAAPIEITLAINENGQTSFTFRTRDALGALSPIQTVTVSVAFVNQAPDVNSPVVLIKENFCVVGGAGCGIPGFADEFARVVVDDFDDEFWRISFAAIPPDTTGEGELYFDVPAILYDGDVNNYSSSLYDFDFFYQPTPFRHSSGCAQDVLERINSDTAVADISEADKDDLLHTCTPYDTLTFTVLDGFGLPATGAMTVIVIPIDQNPDTLGFTETATRNVDFYVTIVATDEDDNVASLTIDSISIPSTISGTATLKYVLNPAVSLEDQGPDLNDGEIHTFDNDDMDNSWTFAYNGPYVLPRTSVITFFVTDATSPTPLTSPTYTGTFLMGEDFVPPNVWSDTVSINEDETLPFVFNFGERDDDEEVTEHYFDIGYTKDTIDLFVVSAPAHGTAISDGVILEETSAIRRNGDGDPSFVYTPGQHETDTVTLVFRAVDDDLLDSVDPPTATITIEIIPVNDPPNIAIDPALPEQLSQVPREVGDAFDVIVSDVDSPTITVSVVDLLEEFVALEFSDELIVYDPDGVVVNTYTVDTILSPGDNIFTINKNADDSSDFVFRFWWTPDETAVDDTSGTVSLRATDSDVENGIPSLNSEEDATGVAVVRPNIPPVTVEDPQGAYTISVLQNEPDFVVSLVGSDANIFHDPNLLVEITSLPVQPSGDAAASLFILPDGSPLSGDGPWAITASAGDPSGTVGDIIVRLTENFNGRTSFNFRVTDALQATSEEATITVDVAFVNQPPEVDDNILIINEDDCFTETVTLIARDHDDETLTFTEFLNPVTGEYEVVVRAKEADYGYCPPDNEHSVCPDPIVAENCEPFTTVVVTVTDSVDQSDDANVVVIVLPVDDAPTVDSFDVTATEDVALDITITARDEDGDLASLIITSTTFAETLQGIATFTGPDNENIVGAELPIIYAAPAPVDKEYTFDFTYTGPHLVQVEDLIEYHVVDLEDLEGEGTGVVRMEKQFIPPVTRGDSITTPEDTPVTFTFEFEELETPDDELENGEHYGDRDGTVSSTTIVIIEGPDSDDGILTTPGDDPEEITNGSPLPGDVFVYTPPNDFTGDVTVTFIAIDEDTQESAESVITITVLPADDPPVINITPEDIVDVPREDVARFVVSVLDIDSNIVSVSVTDLVSEFIELGFSEQFCIINNELNTINDDLSNCYNSASPIMIGTEIQNIDQSDEGDLGIIHQFFLEWHTTSDTPDGTFGVVELKATADEADSDMPFPTGRAEIIQNEPPYIVEIPDGAYTITIRQDPEEQVILVPLRARDPEDAHDRILDIVLRDVPDEFAVLSPPESDNRYEDGSTVPLLEDGDEFHLVPGSHGVVEVTIEPNFYGEITFTFDATDPLELTSELETVTITVEFVNQPPVARDIILVLPEDYCVFRGEECPEGQEVLYVDADVEDVEDREVNEDGSDANPLEITFLGLGSPADGNLGGGSRDNEDNDNASIFADVGPHDESLWRLWYQPVIYQNSECNEDFDPVTGDGCLPYATFDYFATDPAGLTSDPATLTVIVTPVEHPPVTSDVFASESPADLVLNGDDPDDDVSHIIFLEFDFDSDATVVEYMGEPVTLNTPYETPNDEDEWSVTYIRDPLRYERRTDMFTYMVVDLTDRNSNIGTATIELERIIVPPTADDGEVTGNEDEPIPVPFNYCPTEPEHYCDRDSPNDNQVDVIIETVPEGGELYTVDNELVVPGTVITGSDKTLTFIPEENFVSDPQNPPSFTFTVIDEDDETDGPATYTINVLSRDDPPVIAIEPTSIDVDRDTFESFVITSSDIDSANIFIHITGDTLPYAEDEVQLSYWYLTDQNGNVITIEDGSEPLLQTDPTEEGDIIITLTYPTPEAIGEDLSFELFWGPTIDAPDGTTGDFGVYASSFDDEERKTSSAVRGNVAVTPNNPPTIVDNEYTFTAEEDGWESHEFIPTSTDIDEYHDQVLTLTLISVPVGVIIEVDSDGDGTPETVLGEDLPLTLPTDPDVFGEDDVIEVTVSSISMRPVPGFYGETSFDFYATDPLGAISETATITIIIEHVNHPPASQDEILILPEDLCVLPSCGTDILALPFIEIRGTDPDGDERRTLDLNWLDQPDDVLHGVLLYQVPYDASELTLDNAVEIDSVFSRDPLGDPRYQWFYWFYPVQDVHSDNCLTMVTDEGDTVWDAMTCTPLSIVPFQVSDNPPAELMVPSLTAEESNTLTIIVTPTNDPPEARNLEFEINEDEELVVHFTEDGVTFDRLPGFDPRDTDTIFVDQNMLAESRGVQAGSTGTWFNVDGEEVSTDTDTFLPGMYLRFVPPPNEYSWPIDLPMTTLFYRVNDIDPVEPLYSEEYTIIVTVLPVDDPPEFIDETEIETLEDVPVEITLNERDRHWTSVDEGYGVITITDIGRGIFSECNSDGCTYITDDNLPYSLGEEGELTFIALRDENNDNTPSDTQYYSHFTFNLEVIDESLCPTLEDSDEIDFSGCPDFGRLDGILYDISVLAVNDPPVLWPLWFLEGNVGGLENKCDEDTYLRVHFTATDIDSPHDLLTGYLLSEIAPTVGAPWNCLPFDAESEDTEDPEEDPEDEGAKKRQNTGTGNTGQGTGTGNTGQGTGTGTGNTGQGTGTGNNRDDPIIVDPDTEMCNGVALGESGNTLESEYNRILGPQSRIYRIFEYSLFDTADYIEDFDYDPRPIVEAFPADSGTSDGRNFVDPATFNFADTPVYEISFIPFPNWNGNLQLLFVVRDDNEDLSNDEICDLVVDPINDPPSIVQAATAIVLEKYNILGNGQYELVETDTGTYFEIDDAAAVPLEELQGVELEIENNDEPEDPGATTPETEDSDEDRLLVYRLTTQLQDIDFNFEFQLRITGILFNAYFMDPAELSCSDAEEDCVCNDIENSAAATTEDVNTTRVPSDLVDDDCFCVFDNRDFNGVTIDTVGGGESIEVVESDENDEAICVGPIGPLNLYLGSTGFVMVILEDEEGNTLPSGFGIFQVYDLGNIDKEDRPMETQFTIIFDAPADPEAEEVIPIAVIAVIPVVAAVAGFLALAAWVFLGNRATDAVTANFDTFTVNQQLAANKSPVFEAGGMNAASALYTGQA